MKNKLILILLFALTLVCSLSVLVGCASVNKLQTPDLFGIDEDNVLSWSDVDLARGYVVRVDNGKGAVNETTTTRTTYSLDGLEVGEYFISVCAVGNNRDKKNSDWSEKLDFQKKYSSGLIYKLIENDSAYAVMGVGKASGDVVIEDYYRNGKPVLMIGTRAFKDNRNVTSVTIGKNVSQISEGAFYGCSRLKTVELPDDLLYIGESAFQNCTSLERIRIPSGVSTIYQYTFAFCRELKEVIFDTEEITLADGETVVSGVTSIGTGAFQDCRSIEELTLPSCLKGIESSAFTQMTGLTKIAIPDSVEYINSEAFSYDVSLKEVKFGEGSKATYIGKRAFSGCNSLTTLELSDSLEEIAAGAFYGCSLLDDITIPETVATIGSDAFYGTKEYLTQIEQQKMFIYIDRWLIKCVQYINETADDKDAPAGEDAPRKWSVVPKKDIKELLPDKLGDNCPSDGIIGIGVSCFNSTDLERIVLPDTVRYVSEEAFANTKKLQTFKTETDNSVLERIGTKCFYKSSLEMFYLPSGLKTIGKYAFYNCKKLGYINAEKVNKIPASVERIGQQAFRKTKFWEDSLVSTAPTGDGIVRIEIIGQNTCWIVDYKNINEDGETIKLTTVKVAEEKGSEDGSKKGHLRASHVADYAFYLLDSLVTVEKSELLGFIGTGAFYGCTSLKGMVVHSSFTKINPYTFYGCKSLKSFSIADATIASDLSEIGEFAFYDCESLESFSLDTMSIKRISPYSFAYCYRLKSFDFADAGVEIIDSYAFYGDISLEEIKLPDTVTAIGYNTFFECDALRKVDFGSGMKYIYDSAFYSCSSLRSIELPSSLLYLGNKAFYKCYALTKVKFATERTEEGVSGLQYIGNYVFFNDERLSSVDLPASLVRIGKYAFKGVAGAGSVTLNKSVDTIGAHAFYGLDNLTVYTAQTENPVNWSGRWNSFQRPVVWGCVLDENEGYVLSLTITKDTFSYLSDYYPLSAPRRNGWVFSCWKTEDGSQYSENELKNAPLGSVLYAEWLEIGEEWKYEKNSEGRITYAIVGKGEIPEELTITTKKSESSDDSSGGSAASSTADEQEEEDYFMGGSQLCGWSYVQGGEPVFLMGMDFLDDRLSLIVPGTKIYAVYYTEKEYNEACKRYTERVDSRKVVSANG